MLLRYPSRKDNCEAFWFCLNQDRIFYPELRTAPKSTRKTVITEQALSNHSLGRESYDKFDSKGCISPERSLHILSNESGYRELNWRSYL